MKKVSIIVLLLFQTSIIFSQNTLSFDSEKGSPPATIHQISWLAGYWKGEAFGGIVEELWAPPLGGTMMGVFKSEGKGKVNFYEIETISEVDGSLILRLKHFHSNLKGWEEKDETVDFKLVKIEKNKVYFDGFTIERISKKEINMYVVIGGENGKSEEVIFNYKKQKL